MKNVRRLVSFALFTILLCAGSVGPVCLREAEAHSSKEWLERLKVRTVTLWVEGQFLDTLVLNARGELNVTWLERGLSAALNQDRDVEEWLLIALGHYSSSRKENQAKLKGKDVFVLNYRAAKRWNFDPTKLVIGGYAVTADDVLTREGLWESGELPPGASGTVAVCAPSLKRGQKAEMRYEDAAAVFEVPRK